MSDVTALPQVIDVLSDKCTNCHRCIGVCPVKYCNNASDTTKGIVVDHNLCIACGACLKACSHEARVVVDDTERFFADLQKGERIATLVAPAVGARFYGDSQCEPTRNLGSFLGWLRSQGVVMNFDVSFGAEITTYQYLRALQAGAKRPIIAQPCPAVVSFIEIYKPNLRPHLAPTGSPTMDMACWVHANHPGMKLAFISPCIGKPREFADANTKNRVHYNVTLTNLMKYMAEHQVDLGAQPSVGFDGPMEAERGLLYSQPGGLYETFKRYDVKVKRHQIRRVEGADIYDEYFDELERDIAKGECDVILVDVLNCVHGCNRGTGMPANDVTTDGMLRRQSERIEAHMAQHYPTDADRAKLEKTLQSMSNIDFSRQYSDKSANFAKLDTPTPEMINVLHAEMKKVDKKDKKNCGACGYNSCDAMAKAILNGLYRPEQCHHYLERVCAEH
jgi:iron only hydrogenase large subunit-like protein